MTIVAWHNQPALKVGAVRDMIQHRELDEIVGGSYVLWSNQDARRVGGCFHGCLTLDAYANSHKLSIPDAAKQAQHWTSSEWHSRTEAAFGIPIPVGKALDAMFERLDDLEEGDQAGFAVETLQAMQPGADLLHALEAWFATLISDPEWGLVPHAGPSNEPIGQLAAAIPELIAQRLAGEVVDWEAVEMWAELITVNADREREGAELGSGELATFEKFIAARTLLSIVDYFIDDLPADHVVTAFCSRRYSGPRTRWMAQTLIGHLWDAPVVTGPLEVVVAPLGLVSDSKPGVLVGSYTGE